MPPDTSKAFALAPGIDPVQKLHSRTRELADGELAQLFHRQPDWSEAEREEVRRCMDRVLRQVLHAPMQALQDSGADRAQRLAVFAHFFALNPHMDTTREARP